MKSLHELYSILGIVLIVLISWVAARMSVYWRSFLFHWPRYRQTAPVATDELRHADVPYVKIQITTRGSQGSTRVITRGIRHLLDLAVEDREFYRSVLSVEVLTESQSQADHIDSVFRSAPLHVEAIVLPREYRAPNGTELKARALHYAVECRRAGWNRKPGRTFIVHFDEESVIVPREMRKLLMLLSTTTKKLLEGPIYYPLDYMESPQLCRSMEANRPIGCFECRDVMERGRPLHLHGSNLVIDESLENELGWDIGTLEGHPFIAEDYIFGLMAYLAGGPGVFGWHGCVMFEQPPFSVKSAFRQRYRWVFGVLQGLSKCRHLEAFTALPRSRRASLRLGTIYRLSTFALGSIVGILSSLYLSITLLHVFSALADGTIAGLPLVISAWMGIVGALWLGAVFIGATYNLSEAGLPRDQVRSQIALAVGLAPIAGIIESTAALWAIVRWAGGVREVQWVPTPKTREAETAASVTPLGRRRRQPSPLLHSASASQ